MNMTKQNKGRKFFAVSASAALVASAIVPVAASAAFNDEGQISSWAKESVEYVSENGFMNGKTGGNFDPKGTFTRAEAAVIAVNVLGLDKDQEFEGSFGDVSEGQWWFGAIEAAKEAGIVSGLPNGNFNPNGKLSRQDAAIILTKIYDLDVDSADLSVLDQFSDKGQIGAYATKYLAALVEAGVINGSNGKINPTGDITREELAVMLAKTDQSVVEVDPGELLAELEEALEAVETAVAALPEATTVTKENAADAQAKVTAAQTAITAAQEALDAAVEVEALTEEEATAAQTAIDAAQAKVDAVKAAVAEATKPVVGLAVESVSAINATELQVTFNTAVDATSAKNPDAYVITLNDKKYGTATGGLTYDGTVSSILDTTTSTPIHVSQDGKTVTFKLVSTEYLAHGDKYSIDVKDSILSKDGSSTVERYGDTQKVYSDLVAPTLASTVLKGTDLELTFNEPVDITGTNFGITVDGVDVTTLATVTTDPLDYTVTIPLNATTHAALLKPGNHDVTVFNARDFVVNNANTGNRASILTGAYTVSGEATIPAVAKLDAIDFNSFDVEFNKVVTDGRIIVKRGNTVFYDQTFTGGTTDTQTIALPVSAISPSAGLTWLYDTNATSTQVTVEVIDYKDGSSLFGSKYTSALTLKRDDVTPTAVSAGINAGDTGFDVQLNRAVDLTATTVAVPATLIASGLDTNKIKVTDKNGVVRTLTSATIDAAGKVSVVLDGFDGTTVKASNFAPFKVEFAAGTVVYDTDKIKVVSPKDNVGNDFATTEYTNKLANAAFTTNVATTNSAYKAVEGVASVAIAQNVITVTYKETVDASATKLENYSLDGKALPTGTTITLDGTNKVVTIVLPKETYATQQKRALGVSTNVKTVAGEHVVGNLGTKEAYLSQLLQIEDNTKPVLVSAKFLNVAADNTTNEIELTFSENVTVTANNTNFIVIAHDGTEIKATTTAVAAADNSKVVKLTLDSPAKVNTLQTVKVKVAEKSATNATLLVDNTGLTTKNEVVTGTIVTVTK